MADNKKAKFKYAFKSMPNIISTVAMEFEISPWKVDSSHLPPMETRSTLITMSLSHGLTSPASSMTHGSIRLL